MTENVYLNRLLGLKSISSDFCRSGTDYIFSHITSSSKDPENQEIFVAPMKMTGFTLFFLVKGSIEMEINTKSYLMKPKSLLVMGHSGMVRVDKIDWKKLDLFCLYLSDHFLRDVNIDLNVFNFRNFEKDPSPLIDNLSEDEAKLIAGYMYLMYHNADTNGQTIYSKNVARSLVQALIYQMMQIGYNHTRSISDEKCRTANRRLAYVREFMQLVQKHHTQERSLAFYADKLFISPKYLSRLIKDSTGKSAADWIDHFVLIDAKNMLRFSSKNVQQVAYALNFSTQSSFGKFFKHLTGMSPSEYQQT